MSLLVMACNAQSGNKLVNKGKSGFELDISFYPEDNNFSRSAVIVKDGYIIAGQKFTKQGSVTQPSALMKITRQGKLIRQEFLGNNGGFEKTARLETLFRIDTNRIIQVGQKSHSLWLREINEDLDVIRDTVVAAVPMDVLFPPILVLTSEGFYIVANPGYITLIDKEFKKIDCAPLITKSDSAGLSGFGIRDAAFHQKSGLFYIVGNGCVERNSDDCLKHKELLLVYDVRAKRIINKLPLDEFNTVKCIEIDGDTIYIAGESRQPLKDESLKKYYITNNFDFVVSSFDLKGKKISQFKFDETEHEFVNDMSISKGRIYVAGELFDKASISFKSIYVAFDLKGTALEKRVFGTGYENRLTKIYQTDDGKRLLLGKENGWRVVLVK